MTRQRSGFRQQKLVSFVPEPSKHPTHYLLAGETWTGTSQPVSSGRFGQTRRFQSRVLCFRLFYFWSCIDIGLLIAKYQLWYAIVHFGFSGCLHNQKQERHAPWPILKNDTQWHGNDGWSYIVGDLGGDWI